MQSRKKREALTVSLNDEKSPNIVIYDYADPLKTGREAWLRNMLKVLVNKGYSGEALENRINVEPYRGGH